MSTEHLDAISLDGRRGLVCKRGLLAWPPLSPPSSTLEEHGRAVRRTRRQAAPAGTTTMTSLIEHLEAHLGPIAAGWSRDADGHELPFQVVRFSRGPLPGAELLVTLGLSHAPLRLGDTSRHLQQELLVMYRESDGPGPLPGVLQQVATTAMERGRAWNLGEVIGPRGALRAGSTVEALYVAMPVYLPDSFHVYRRPAHPPIVFGWLVPITASEAKLARSRGRDAFEEVLATSDPDLLDFQRASIV